jgi:hypothetical protein
MKIDLGSEGRRGKESIYAIYTQAVLPYESAQRFIQHVVQIPTERQWL